MTPITQVELRSKMGEELTPLPEEPNGEVRAKLRRERFAVLWYGVIGRCFRFTVLFISIFLLIFMVLMGIENYIK
jgi:hypothetical protein